MGHFVICETARGGQARDSARAAGAQGSKAAGKRLSGPLAATRPAARRNAAGGRRPSTRAHGAGRACGLQETRGAKKGENSGGQTVAAEGRGHGTARRVSRHGKRAEHACTGGTVPPSVVHALLPCAHRLLSCVSPIKADWHEGRQAALQVRFALHRAGAAVREEDGLHRHAHPRKAKMGHDRAGRGEDSER